MRFWAYLKKKKGCCRSTMIFSLKTHPTGHIGKPHLRKRRNKVRPCRPCLRWCIPSLRDYNLQQLEIINVWQDARSDSHPANAKKLRQCPILIVCVKCRKIFEALLAKTPTLITKKKKKTMFGGSYLSCQSCRYLESDQVVIIVNPQSPTAERPIFHLL